MNETLKACTDLRAASTDRSGSACAFGDVVESRQRDRARPGRGRRSTDSSGWSIWSRGSLHIRAWGNVADGTTFTRRCRPGQVLFGKRRAYQRKVAVAEFDAVVLGRHLRVLRRRTTACCRNSCRSCACRSGSSSRAVETSAGSLSPRTNWSHLARFEFALPPLDQQRRIAEILWAVDESVEASVANFDLLSSLKQAAMEEYTLYGTQTDSNGHQFPRYPMRLLGDMTTKCQYGLSYSLSESGSYPILRMMNYDEELVVATELKYADMPAEVAAEFEVQKGDILFNRTNSADLVGKVGLFNLDGCFLFASYLVRIQTNRSLLLPEFLNYYLNSRHGQAAVRAFATPGVSQSNINAGSLKKVKVPVPSLHEQAVLVRKLDDIASACRTSRTHIAKQRSMLKASVNAVLEG